MRMTSGFGHEIFPLLFAGAVAGQILGGRMGELRGAKEAGT